jgi:hypothetical protein
MLLLFNYCYNIKEKMCADDRKFIEYLSSNWPNYENEWLFDVLLEMKEKYNE